MPVEYEARSGKTYYLHGGTTKKGKQRFYFSPKTEGTLADEIPDGYEIYENVNALVFLRKATPEVIHDEERRLVEQETMKGTIPGRFKVEIKANMIIVYESLQDPQELMADYDIQNSKRFLDHFRRRAKYSPIMRFLLEDQEERLFLAQRFCFRGSVDDWIYIGGPDTLEKQAGRFIGHSGKESFLNGTSLDFLRLRGYNLPKSEAPSIAMGCQPISQVGKNHERASPSRFGSRRRGHGDLQPTGGPECAQ